MCHNLEPLPDFLPEVGFGVLNFQAKMKTNVVLKSPDRKLFGIKVRQETKTGFLNLSDLQNAYNSAALQFGWQQRRVDQFLENETNKERLYELLLETKMVNVGFSTFTELLDKEPVKYLKSIGAWKTTGRGHNKTTFANPYVWVSIAMWMNPKIYAKTVVWLTDSLLSNRVNAGWLYRELSYQLSTFDNADYAVVARALNHVVFGRHENGIRQTATANQLKELSDLENKMAFAIESGFVSNQDQLIEVLRKEWTKKFNRNIICQAA